jgi:hypothetical protein
MKEATWVRCTDPTSMLQFVRDKASDRKLRLFAVACCRHLQNPWPVPAEYGEFLEWAEFFADGEASPEDLADVREQVRDYVEDYAPDWWTGIAKAIACAMHLPHPDVFGIRQATLQVLRYDQFPGEESIAQERDEFGYQASLLRELLGLSPFRPLSVNPAWRTPMVVALAQEIYDRRSFDRLSTLADALKEAGCTNADILAHAERPEEHVLGCWVVDLLLTRE